MVTKRISAEPIRMKVRCLVIRCEKYVSFLRALQLQVLRNTNGGGYSDNSNAQGGRQAGSIASSNARVAVTPVAVNEKNIWAFLWNFCSCAQRGLYFLARAYMWLQVSQTFDSTLHANYLIRCATSSDTLYTLYTTPTPTIEMTRSIWLLFGQCLTECTRPDLLRHPLYCFVAVTLKSSLCGTLWAMPPLHLLRVHA